MTGTWKASQGRAWNLSNCPTSKPKNVKSTLNYIYRSEYFISGKICQKAVFCHVGQHFAITKNAGHVQKWSCAKCRL
jgi:hypothetical protein